jgi:hypothetical protein
MSYTAFNISMLAVKSNLHDHHQRQGATVFFERLRQHNLVAKEEVALEAAASAVEVEMIGTVELVAKSHVHAGQLGLG